METWDTLVPVIVQYLQDNHEHNLKQLFLMIKETLIHADVGILEKINESQVSLVDLNTWLLFTTVKALTNTPNDAGMMDATVQLQSEVLSASFHKNMQLLRVLVDKLIEFVSEVMKYVTNNNFPVKISFINPAPTQTKMFSSTNLYDTVMQFKDLGVVYSVLITELRVFTQIIGLIGDSHPDVVQKVTDLYMKLFGPAPMRVKIEIMDYFSDTLKKNMNVTHAQLSHCLTIITHFGNLLRYKVVWCNGTDDKFSSESLHSSIKAFLKEITKGKVNRDPDFVENVAMGLIKWINNVGECLISSKSNIWSVRQMVKIAVKKLKKLNENSGGVLLEKHHLLSFLDYLEVLPELCSLFPFTLAKEIQNPTQEKPLLESLFQKLNEISKKTTSIHAYETLQPLEAALILWKNIFNLIQNTTESIISQSQVVYMEQNDEIPQEFIFTCPESLKPLTNILTPVVTSLLNHVAKTNLTLTNDFMVVFILDFVYSALNDLSDLQLLPDEIKNHLIYFLLSPFSRMSSELSNKLPKNFTKFFTAQDKQPQSIFLHNSLMLNLILSLKMKTFSNEVTDLITGLLNYVMTSAACETFRDECVRLVPRAIVTTKVPVSWLCEDILNWGFNHKKYSQLLEIFLDLVALMMSDTIVFCVKNANDINEYLILAPNALLESPCTCPPETVRNGSVFFLLEKIRKRHGMLMGVELGDGERQLLNDVVQKYIPIVTCVDLDAELQLKLVQILPQLIKNVSFMLEPSTFAAWFKILASPDPNINALLSTHITSIHTQIRKRMEMDRTNTVIITSETLQMTFLDQMIALMKHAYEKDEVFQSYVLLLLQNYTAASGATEFDVLWCFRFALRFLLKVTSKVKHQAFGTCKIIARNFNVHPHQILNWERMKNMKFMMEIVAANFVDANVKMRDTIQMLPALFGSARMFLFINRYHKTMVANLVPIILKVPQCGGLLIEIASLCNKEPRILLRNSISNALPFAYVYHSPEMTQKCIKYYQDAFGSTNVFDIIFSSEKYVSDILIYYHKHPACVLEIFKNYNTKSDPLTNLSDYLGNNILGVLKHFEINMNSEKQQQQETLLSLGQIIRLIGTERITPYRFKIMTILNTALGSSDSTTIGICIKIWNIFVHTVDMMELGQILSSIIVSLKPFITDYPEEIDEIFTYLIVDNSNLLNKYFTDIFFLDELPIRDELKKAIAVQHKMTDHRKSFLDQLDEYLRHITHKNVVVRAYGLKYLGHVLRANRTELNNLIINDAVIHPILGGLLRNLMICCKENDQNVQKYAAECLGELGALEPSHLPPDYQPHSGFAFSIHTTEFAKLALEKLCHAYLVQSDVSNVDCFALAIQEVLIANNVDPSKNKNMEIWNAMPTKMRSFIEPLLNSQYTPIRKKTTIEIHPIYGTVEAKSCEEWAFVWATKIIEQITVEVTRNLLDAFAPSIKRDLQILSMIFPYIILHAILSSNAQTQKEIFQEMTTVLEDTLNADVQMALMDSQEESLQYEHFLTTPRFCYSQHINEKSHKENMRLKCSKIIFGLLDFLERYLCELITKYPRATEKEDYRKVKQFIDRFDYKMLARANYECEEYARALWYLEKYINEDSCSRLQGELGFLAKIHAELLDPDSVEGAMAVKEDEPSLEEQILLYNVTGRLHESAVCFERMMQQQKNNPAIMKDIVGCYLGLDQPETALLVSESYYTQLLEDNPNLVLQANCAEPLWRLSRWDELEKLIDESDLRESDIWGINCGQLLIDFRGSKHEKFDEEIDRIRLSLLRVLKTHESEQSIYQKCYSQILKLHMLTEVQKAELIMREMKPQVGDRDIRRALTNMLSDWEARNEVLQPTSHIMEPLLCLRRIILSEMQELLDTRLSEKPRALKAVSETINQSIGKLWMQSTRLASKAKMFQQAALYVMNAEKYAPPELYIEKAKLAWDKGDQTTALKILDQGVDDTMQTIGGDIRVLSPPDLKLFGEARLLVAVYNSEAAKFSPDFNLKCFKESVETYPQQEKAYFLYAQYFERVYENIPEMQQKKRIHHDHLVSAMVYYGKSLMYGCTYIHQSMPRLLTIWLDFTARKDEHASKSHMQQLNQYMQRYLDSLPKFMFFTAFSQLVSRICHPNPEVYTILKSILISLINAYPQQSLWMFLAVYKSTYEIRVKRCKEILNDKRLASIGKFIWNFNDLTEEMIRLTNAELSEVDEASGRSTNGTVSTTVTKLHSPLHAFFQMNKNVRILMPIQEQMSVIMPPSRDRDKPADYHKPFPNDIVYIQGIMDRVTILSSLQKPKKITLIGSNGRQYDFLMKPKDDLRKDFRLMEFNNVIKQLLYEDTDARQRRLHIRTYAVLPLNDECGIIEWVQNVMPYRNIIMRYYKQLGRGVSMRELKNKYPNKRDSVEKKKQIFETYLLPNHPLVFADWFRERFPNPHDWYQARCGYIKTLAVMSMVGYVLGLGDRHGENILLDQSCGDVVHVDFNCLFNRGELFDVPEVVPFRLTHNMVKAMGPLGVDGLFRKCCEITMRVMQKQQNILMSVLRPFVYDPLVSWTKTTSKAQLLNQERTDPQSSENLRQVDHRLKGYVKIDGKRSDAPLSTVGQVNHCITEATDVVNLASMYVGWGSYL